MTAKLYSGTGLYAGYHWESRKAMNKAIEAHKAATTWVQCVNCGKYYRPMGGNGNAYQHCPGMCERVLADMAIDGCPDLVPAKWEKP